MTKGHSLPKASLQLKMLLTIRKMRWLTGRHGESYCEGWRGRWWGSTKGRRGIWPNWWSGWLEINGFPCWVSLCLLRSTFLWNARPHMSHENGLYPVCFLVWVIRLLLWLNAFPHTLHLWGFSPEMWRLRVCFLRFYIMLLKMATITHMF